jgi:polyisoprenyl-phosphate glycosyltransferase
MSPSKVDTFVSVIAPLHDDGDIVSSFVEDLFPILRDRYSHFEIVLVDDGSNDDTLQVVDALLTRFHFVRLIRLSKRFGDEVAILAGMETVIGDFVVVMLPDTDPPELVPSMIETSRAGFDIVSGTRRIQGRQPIFMRLFAPIFYWYCNRVLRLSIPENTTEFRVLSRQVVNAVIRTRDLMRFMRMYSAYVGFPNTTMEYDKGSRRGTPRRRTLTALMSRSVGIIVANSTHPLRVVSVLGILISGLNAMYAGYVVLTYLFKADVAPGWATLSLQISMMFFFMFLVLAVLSAYIGRLLQEGNRVPQYYVLEERQSSVLVEDDGRKNVVEQAEPPAVDGSS